MFMRHNVELLHGRCIVVLHYRWDYRDVHYFDSMKLLYTLKLEGKIKELGLTNFDTVHMAKLYEECAIPIVSNQVKFDLSSAPFDCVSIHVSIQCAQYDLQKHQRPCPLTLVPFLQVSRLTIKP
jgi:aryl-alcohol dehydrogenase-like predicted oxidoreductase